MLFYVLLLGSWGVLFRFRFKQFTFMQYNKFPCFVLFLDSWGALRHSWGTSWVLLGALEAFLGALGALLRALGTPSWALLSHAEEAGQNHKKH